MTNSDDLVLVERCRAGDRAALAELVERYQRPVYNAAYRVLGNVEDARDVTQTVFMKACEQLDGFDARYKFFSWIYRIAVNESLNLLRRNRREQPVDGLDGGDGSTDPAFLADEAELGAQVQRALMKMKAEDRVVLTLRHFGDCSYCEIAAIVGVPEKTVKSRLYAARQRLRELLHAWHG